MPKNGQSLLDLFPQERAYVTLKLAKEDGDGWRVPVAVPEAGPFRHVGEPSQLEMLMELSVAHPLAAFVQKLKVTGHHLTIARKAFVFASGYSPSTFARFADEARSLGWPVEDLPTHHLPMLSMPRQTAEVLLRRRRLAAISWQSVMTAKLPILSPCGDHWQVDVAEGGLAIGLATVCRPVIAPSHLARPRGGRVAAIGRSMWRGVW